LNSCDDFHNLFLFYFFSALYAGGVPQTEQYTGYIFFFSFRFSDEISIDVHFYLAVALFATKQIEAPTAILINNNFLLEIFRVGTVAGNWYVPIVHTKISFQR